MEVGNKFDIYHLCCCLIWSFGWSLWAWIHGLPLDAGTRYGASLRKQIKKMEVSQHSKYFCEFCGKVCRPWLYIEPIVINIVCQCWDWSWFQTYTFCCSMRWRGKLLAFGAARTVGKSRQAVPTLWSKDILWTASPYLLFLAVQVVTGGVVNFAALLVLWLWGAQSVGWGSKLKAELATIGLLPCLRSFDL